MHESKSGGLCDRFSAKRRSVLAFLLLTGLGLSGCGPKVKPNEVDLKGGTSQTDQDKIRGYLDAAGLKGQIVSIMDGGEKWMVDVGAEPAAPGKRQAPVAPASYLVDKKTGKVDGAGGAGGPASN